ncbi:MAG: DUF4389 domain-containing protein [Arenicellales bacterium]|jgi:predicted ferric reductase|nr:lipase [Acidiferrobacteraceae bacterium]MDP6123449.1 DUF4389 domain-containing protein [Arenicellales bacterium]MDP6289391.1 DUF4389 domain-containing protein [Arenicellales bacterium]MDP6433924.1 DUF4389 domain-containing protein [Arenicellales bacterium]MDP6672651.1 DUF4389 domain-containing protein [Arenicellales bacterium]|tara:strand:+ start:821 stop:1159 length:339 start_codon:yes stop_codon:yes gene_type:complete
MSESDSNSISNPSIWWRLLFILIYFSVVFYAVKVVITLVVVFQFLHQAIKGEPNERILSFTSQLNGFNYHALQYITFNIDERPFPFTDWPDAESVTMNERGNHEPPVPYRHF